MSAKPCNQCETVKPLSAFKPDKRNKDGCAGTCRDCYNAGERRAIAAGKRDYGPARQKWWAENRDKHNRRRRTTHMQQLGVSIEEYDEMLEKQGGTCAICGGEETAELQGKPKRLAVDHDHVTGVVRGLLCARCNRALGGFRDDPGLLRAAIDYLQMEEVATCRS